MILGMSTQAFTQLHVIISLIAIIAGLYALFAMLAGRISRGATAIFLAFTILTSVTGFIFPATAFDPARIVGLISLVALAIAVTALYAGHLAGVWRATYVVTAILALWLNVFVGVTQSFQKLSFLQPLAPTQSEPPFVIAQLVVLVLFILAAIATLRRRRLA